MTNTIIIQLGNSIDWKPKISESPKVSTVRPSEAQVKEIMNRDRVWVSDPIDGFIAGTIVDLTDDGVLISTPSRGNVHAPFDRLYPSEEENAKDVEDNCGLMFLNEATLLENIRKRYVSDKIYTYVANIPVSYTHLTLPTNREV